MLDAGVAHHHVGEGLGVDLQQNVGAGQAIEVVEAVAVLQLQQLGGEDCIKGAAQLAIDHLGFCQATHP